MFYEKFASNTCINYDIFSKKLKEVENILDKNKKIESTVYIISNISWESVHQSNKKYPSELFSKVLMNLEIVGNDLVNIPPFLDLDSLRRICYVHLNRNNLNIIDALMEHGSKRKYVSIHSKEKIYSEHSGCIEVINNAVSKLILNPESDRIDIHDKSILMPRNNDIFAKYEFIFHTHPNASRNGGRINEGILYEFPSASDIFNFIKYHKDGILQGSLIVSPEGVYLIRRKNYLIDLPDGNINSHKMISDFILSLERESIQSIKTNLSNISELSNSDIFYQNVSSNTKYINSYNKFLDEKMFNLFIDYYPRERDESLREINLIMVSQ